MTAVYDTIGRSYAQTRRVDPRIDAAITRVLGDSHSIVNVGAGTGAYEPHDRHVVAVEPSRTMISLRSSDAHAALQGIAEALPFADNAFDATLAVLTVHHWRDVTRGLRECRRVARDRVVIFTWDPSYDGGWLFRDYFTDLLARDRERFPTISDIRAALGELEIVDVPIPADCVDGFAGAYWQRPHAYLDENIRSGISVFSQFKHDHDAFVQLRSDLDSGAWHAKYAPLLKMTELDMGYRLIVARR